MPTETTARARQLQPDAPDETDYHAFCTALSESARGRAFLAEYARRNRNADTRPLLTAGTEGSAFQTRASAANASADSGWP